MSSSCYFPAKSVEQMTVEQLFVCTQKMKLLEKPVKPIWAISFFVSSSWFAAKSVEQLRVEQSQFEQFTMSRLALINLKLNFWVYTIYLMWTLNKGHNFILTFVYSQIGPSCHAARGHEDGLVFVEIFDLLRRHVRRWNDAFAMLRLAEYPVSIHRMKYLIV